MIRSMTRSTVANKTDYRSMAAGNLPGAYELIATQNIVSANTNVVIQFDAIPQEYKHLQIRYTARTTSSTSPTSPSIYLNGYNPATTGAIHGLEGNTTSVTSYAVSGISYIDMGASASAASPTSTFAAGIIDVLDYASSSKNKTVRTLSGVVEGNSNSRIRLSSGFHVSTTAVSSFQLSTNSGSIYWVPGSRISLYGIRG